MIVSLLRLFLYVLQITLYIFKPFHNFGTDDHTVDFFVI